MNVFWHRRDLRVPDNRGLALAARDDETLPVYVVDTGLLARVGTRQRAFFLEGVRELKRDYRRRGGDLLVAAGEPVAVLGDVRDAVDADRVYFNRHYRPARRIRERAVADDLPTKAVTDLVLVDPGTLDDRYENHGRFYDDWQDEPKPDPFDPPAGDALVDPREASDIGLDVDAGLPDPDADTDVDLPDADADVDLPDADADVDLPDADADVDLPDAGYAAARERFDRFLADGIETYADTRDDVAAAVERPVGAVSRVSPYLTAGMIGVREVWAAASERHALAGGDARRNVEKYRYELSWREHDYHLLYHNPDLATANYDDPPNPVAWENDPEQFAAWRRGETGYPFVDAGMRQLNEEGYVHNRPRQNVASFLTKHLLVDWRAGARYFRERLVDHDPAANAGNWQWIASTGTDSVDVRVFDPVAQMAKYDDSATYVQEYVSELRDVPPEKIVDWPTLSDADRERLAPEYPHPVVDRDAAYERARRVFADALGKR